MEACQMQRCVIEFLHEERNGNIDIHHRLVKIYGVERRGGRSSAYKGPWRHIMRSWHHVTFNVTHCANLSTHHSQ